MEKLVIKDYQVTFDGDLLQRAGCIKLRLSDMFMPPETAILKALFSNFYPYGIHADHTYGMYNGILYYGYSLYFDKIAEGDKLPMYEAIFTSHVDRTVSLTGMNKIIE